MNDTYKKTKLGWTPKEWEVVKLEKLLDLLTDFESNGSFASVKANVTIFDEYEFSWYVRATDLENDSPLSKVKYVDEKSYKFLRKTKLFGGEVLLTKRGEIGKVYFFEKPTDVNATLAPNLYLLKINDLLINKYLYYYFLSSLGQKRLKRINASATIGALYKDDVKKLQIPLPPLPEQKKIAKILSTVDAKINNISNQITETQQLKKGLMQQLLTEGIGHSEFKESKLGKIPRSWDVVKLGEVCSKIIDGTHHTPKYVEKGIPFYSVENVTNNNFTNTKYISEAEHEKLTKRCKPEKGDILMTRIGSLADAKLITWDVNASIYVSLALLKVDKSLIDTNFLLQTIKSNDFKKGVLKRSLLNAYPQKINLGEIGKVLIRIPKSFEEQKAIAKILSQVDRKIGNLEAMRGEYEVLKKGLMQVLLSGEVRV